MTKCKIPYPHDFPDTPCKKCNFSWKNEMMNWLGVLFIASLIVLAIIKSL